MAGTNMLIYAALLKVVKMVLLVMFLSAAVLGVVMIIASVVLVSVGFAWTVEMVIAGFFFALIGFSFLLTTACNGRPLTYEAFLFYKDEALLYLSELACPLTLLMISLNAAAAYVSSPSIVVGFAWMVGMAFAGFLFAVTGLFRRSRSLQVIALLFFMSMAYDCEREGCSSSLPLSLFLTTALILAALGWEKEISSRFSEDRVIDKMNYMRLMLLKCRVNPTPIMIFFRRFPEFASKKLSFFRLIAYCIRWLLQLYFSTDFVLDLVGSNYIFSTDFVLDLVGSNYIFSIDFVLDLVGSNYISPPTLCSTLLLKVFVVKG